MTQGDFLKAVSAHCRCTLAEAKTMMTNLTDVMHNVLVAGECVDLPSIGKITVTQQAARKGRNPKTGEAIDIEARKVLKFKAADKLAKTIRTIE